MKDIQPRSRFAIWVIGLILGPVVLMLSFGRGRLAIIYLVAQLILPVLLILIVANGIIAPPAFAYISVVMFILVLPLNIVGIIHASRMRETWLDRPWFSRWYFAIPLPFVAGLLVAFTQRAFLETFIAESGSMIPSLVVGDHFLVSTTDRGNVQRGEVVVFKHPNTQVNYVMRLIGLPGDVIQMRDGVLHINGQTVAKQRIADYVDKEDEGAGRPIPQYVETLPNGVTYRILDLTPDGMADNTSEYLVPASHYFMMGDNRDNSLDSRFDQMGTIPGENLVGPAVAIYWNSQGRTVDGRLHGYHDKL